MSLSLIMDIIGVILLVWGTAACVLGVYGMIRLPDPYNRIHAAGKVMTFGAGGIFLSLLFLTCSRTGIKGLAAALFLFLTAPVVSHILGRAAHRMGVPLGPVVARDDLAEDSVKTVSSR